MLRDLKPVGVLEEILVEKIAWEYWRLGLATGLTMDLSNMTTPVGLKISDNSVRYQVMINRQFYQAIDQLERLQRLRLGEQVPAPVNVQLSHDGTSIFKEENSGL